MSNHKLINAFLILCVAGMPFFSKAQVRPITGTVTGWKKSSGSRSKYFDPGKIQGHRFR